MKKNLSKIENLKYLISAEGSCIHAPFTCTECPINNYCYYANRNEVIVRPRPHRPLKNKEVVDVAKQELKREIYNNNKKELLKGVLNEETIDEGEKDGFIKDGFI